ncbi:MAG: chorismate synthase [Myxococcales bacterium]|nr:MAG: chorismate synthase [Myxococcales bacterium]
MNSFGRIFRVSIFGESHGQAIGVVIDGCPAGIGLGGDDFAEDLARRRGGGPGATTRREIDAPLIQSGVFEGKTTGSPIAVLFENHDIRSEDYDRLRHVPRPGHADFAAHRRYGGFRDHRGGGHFSGRLTAALVAAGVVAKKLIPPIRIRAWLEQAGGRRDIEEAIRETAGQGDSIGGLIACQAENMPIGLGEPFFDSLESLVSHAMFAIPGIKAVEFGAGFKAAEMRGSEFNDAFADASGRTKTNHAGGINGGLSNGNNLSFRVAMRPPSSIRKPQRSFDIRTGQEAELSIDGRHDACIAMRAPVIVEAATAIVLADLLLVERALRPSAEQESVG